MPRSCRNRALTLLAILTIFAFCGEAFSENLKSRYFSIDIHDGVDKFAFLKRIKSDRFLRTGTLPREEGPGLDSLLKEALDALYIEVCDVLDIHMYSYVIDLEIVPDSEYIGIILGGYFQKQVDDMPSFYFHDRNRIYISARDATAGMLAHEVAHAVISHYFAVAPPVRVQEILAGYAEYSARKKARESVK